MPTPTTNVAQELLLLREELQSELGRLEQRLLRRLERLEEAQGMQNNLEKSDEENAEVKMAEVSMYVNHDVFESIPEKEEEEEDQDGVVHFGESAWSFPLVLGLADAGPLDVIFSILLLLLNLGMQLAFSIIIMDDDFMGVPFQSQIEHAQRWRTSVAHDHKHMDLAKTSLVSRVCKVDGALIVSTTQSNLVDQINSFMGLQLDQLEPGFFQPGVLLCMLCILLWSFCVYKEYRSIWLQLEAVWQIPRSSCTEFRDHGFVTISKGRMKLLLFIFTARVAIASLLLFAGIRWLSQTTSISELMLNCVSLNAILDVDEFLFSGFTPISIQLAVQNLTPLKMKYSRRRSQIETSTLLVLMAATILIPYLGLLVPLRDAMTAVKYELCGGNQTFVIGHNTDTQMTIGLVTNQQRDPSELTVTEMSVDRHKFLDANAQPELINFAPTDILFYDYLDRTMEQEGSNWGLCIETAILKPGSPFADDPLIFPLARLMFRQAMASLGSSASDCAEAKALCGMHNARLLRMVCGETCGCSDPWASAWYKVESQGCLPACLRVASQAVASNGCKDKVVQEPWDSFWDAYMDTMSSFYGANVSSTNIYAGMMNLSSHMKSRGCVGLQDAGFNRDLATNVEWCTGMPALFRPFAWPCPESCGCGGSSPPAYCPSTCAA